MAQIGEIRALIGAAIELGANELTFRGSPRGQRTRQAGENKEASRTDRAVDGRG
jgi:hypothetical protein